MMSAALTTTSNTLTNSSNTLTNSSNTLTNSSNTLTNSSNALTNSSNTLTNSSNTLTQDMLDSPLAYFATGQIELRTGANLYLHQLRIGEVEVQFSKCYFSGHCNINIFAPSTNTFVWVAYYRDANFPAVRENGRAYATARHRKVKPPRIINSNMSYVTGDGFRLFATSCGRVFVEIKKTGDHLEAFINIGPHELHWDYHDNKMVILSSTNEAGADEQKDSCHDI